MKKGTLANQKIVVIIEGSLKKAKSGIMVASKAQAWGEEYLLETNKTKIFDDDYVLETDGVIAEISSENFTECIGGLIEDIIKTNEKNHEKKMMRVDPKKREEARNIKLDQLVTIKTLAYGQFGPVYLVKAKHDLQLYALKSFNKIQISE